ncbi:hypothetical protein ATN00_00825 [Sphingobium baderi]|uniref:Phenol degradation protein meta n=1 Tax=Sphingobium baderi TaxID=1332080 RepID=A0A0S3EUG3_9SPHN|nr:hypothetical protein ATN00_00825 [Sphingobium baderi]AMT81314.1 hypothetical protein [Sphingobium baderi]
MCVWTPALATETAGGAYPNGAEALAIAVVPPPGLYFLNYTTSYNADRLNDQNGNSAVPKFALDAYSEVGRFINVTPYKFLGANWAQQAFVSVTSLTVHAAGQHQSKFGFGDLIVDPFILAWGKNDTHFVVGMDTFVPTGGYNKNDLANISRHYWTF